jgi:hypothetical protein
MLSTGGIFSLPTHQGQFVAALEDCHRRGRKLERIGRNATARFYRHYDRRTLASNLLDRYHKLISKELPVK